MKRLAAGILALGLLAGVTACQPSREEDAKQVECATQYIRDNHRSVKTDEERAQVNKELEKACGTGPNFIKGSAK